MKCLSQLEQHLRTKLADGDFVAFKDRYVGLDIFRDFFLPEKKADSHNFCLF